MLPQQLEPLFGNWAKLIFGLGILAAACSSFLVNAMIGGTILSDGLGLGAKLSDSWPRHLTALALVIGMAVGVYCTAKGIAPRQDHRLGAGTHGHRRPRPSGRPDLPRDATRT